ncbi:SDR family NAD(P)-dependent oxidoreductase [Sphingosinicella terrae]|uniref:SDR family NAD(P)-dependent oxidoreductase n=1 Tax=Sphingosinicella terrae TaxID=2172047 RepID=UPI000E0DC724|nr:SDR family NAD(P)-dependent oxidoreductase [Sphingosinicella terrae]
MLADKVVAVTGAGRGIGREIALLAARGGAAVVVNDYGGSPSGEIGDEDPAGAVVAEIESAGGRAVANRANIANPGEAESIIGDALTRFGRIDAVVNNAGILRDRIFHKMSHADWDELIRVNLNGYFYVSKAAANHFREQGSGAYVHFTSTSGLIGNLGQANYSAAKMGVVGLSNSIALDMARSGVRSNCIAPFAWSRMTATIPAETEAERQRVDRFKSMSADKIAPLAVFLCADASQEVSGQIFCVRKNEIFLFSVPRPIRSMHRSEGWTPESVASELLPAFRSSFHPLTRSADIFAWDPV